MTRNYLLLGLNLFTLLFFSVGFFIFLPSEFIRYHMKLVGNIFNFPFGVYLHIILFMGAVIKIFLTRRSLIKNGQYKLSFSGLNTILFIANMLGLILMFFTYGLGSLGV